jgi:predicted glycosyltransferase
MNYLFFFVHPSKFHVFKKTINVLKKKGHNVDILITSKDVLEELLNEEKWEYTNIFPEGRKIKGISPLISSGINFFRTIFRLYRYIGKKKYDLFITDDLLVFLSKIKHVPSIVFTDDDLSITKQFAIILSRANYILAPDITDIQKFNEKKIGFAGYKELAYLHPDEFKPNIEIIKKFNPELTNFFLLRLVSLQAYHDVGKRGLTNEQVLQLIKVLKNKGKVFISSERKLPVEFEKYRLSINPADIAHVLYYADLFIGDSQTMTSEAAVLGTPAFRCNDFAGKINVMDEKEEKYGLSFNFTPNEFEKMLEKIQETLSDNTLNKKFVQRRNKMLQDKINLSKFMIWLFENFPESIKIVRENPNFQFKFR